jgi:hypothetical protein
LKKLSWKRHLIFSTYNRGKKKLFLLSFVLVFGIRIQPEPPAFLYFELNPLTASELAGWLMQEGFASPTLRKDMQGKERFMRVAL